MESNNEVLKSDFKVDARDGVAATIGAAIGALAYWVIDTLL